jgi:GxxExxY protein
MNENDSRISDAIECIEITDEAAKAFCDQIRATAFAIHKYFGHGFREKVYERALVHRLRKQGLIVHVQPPVKIYDEDGTELIEEQMDLIVENVVVVEIKATVETTNGDVAQLLGYLRAAKFRHGLIMNFGQQKFYIKKYVK